MSTIREHTGELVVVRCWCGIQHAVPQSLRDEQMREHNAGRKQSIYCPLGHTYVPAGESETRKLERRLAQERARHDQTRAELETTERRRRAEKAAKTRAKKRHAAGVCPCCKRTFAQLRRHMEFQHPDYDPAA